MLVSPHGAGAMSVAISVPGSVWRCGARLVSHLGRTVCGMSIRELSQRAEIEYVSAATALRRFAARAREDRESQSCSDEQ